MNPSDFVSNFVALRALFAPVLVEMTAADGDWMP